MLKITPIPAFSDNYIWQIQESGESWVVDPGEAAPVINALDGHPLTGILITHHHYDHTGGIPALTSKFGCPVFGPSSIDGVTHPIAAGDTFQVAGRQIAVIDVPGHTLDHLALILENGEESHLFCGDTLFSGGCGRLFEGTPAQMPASLDKLAALPANTRVYCAHEYTEANLHFALAVEPDNSSLHARMAEVQTLRASNRATLPSTIEMEQATNPFLRCTEKQVKATAKARGLGPIHDPIEVFAHLRAWKDTF